LLFNLIGAFLHAALSFAGSFFSEVTSSLSAFLYAVLGLTTSLLGEITSGFGASCYSVAGFLGAFFHDMARFLGASFYAFLSVVDNFTRSGTLVRLGGSGGSLGKSSRRNGYGSYEQKKLFHDIRGK